MDKILPDGTLTLTFEAGMIVRGQIKRELTRAAWEAGLSIEIEEERGFFVSVMRFRVSGDGRRLIAFKAAVEQWAAKLEAG